MLLPKFSQQNLKDKLRSNPPEFCFTACAVKIVLWKVNPHPPFIVMTTMTSSNPYGFSVSAVVADYPSMRLSGDGYLTPSSLSEEHADWVSIANQSINDLNFGQDTEMNSWTDELVFFPVRRMTRLTKILNKSGLRQPTCHHAIALALAVLRIPVVGAVVVAHNPVDSHRLCISAHRYDSYISLVSATAVFKAPVWAVGLR